MKHEVSLQGSQGNVTGAYPQPDEAKSHHEISHLLLTYYPPIYVYVSKLFSSTGFFNINGYSFLISRVLAACLPISSVFI
jgi:hypothetical protein